MAVELATGYVSLTVSAKGIKGDIEKELGGPVAEAAKNAEQSATKSLQSTGQSFTKFGIGALAVAGVVGAGLLKTGQSASNLGESVNAVKVTFGDAADGILKLGEDAAKSVGLSNTAFNGLAVQFSSFATTVAGKGGDVVGTMAEMTGRAADFASVMNIEVADAARMFQSGLAGETEPLKKFGLDLSAAAVEAYAAANGIGTLGGELTEAEKVQARYGLLMEQTSKTQGDFANTADGAANATRIAKAELENASASIGEAVVPAMAMAAGLVSDLAGGFVKLNDATGGWLAKGAGIAVLALGAAGAVSMVVGQVVKFKGSLDTMHKAMVNAEGGLTKMGTASKIAGIGMGIAAAAMAVYTINARQNAQENENLAKSIGEVSRASDADLMKTYFDVIAKGFIANLGNADAMTATMDTFAQSNLDGAKRVRDFTEASIAAGTANKTQLATIDSLNTAIAKEDAAVAQAAKTTDAAATSTSTLTTATDTTTGATEGLTIAQAAAKGATDALKTAADEATRKSDAFAASLQSQIDKLNLLYPKEYDAVVAKYDYAKQTETTMIAVDNMNTTLGDHKAKQEEVKTATDAARDAIIDQSEKYATLNGATLGSEGAIVRQIASLTAQRDSLAPGSPLRQYLNGYIADLDRIQSNISTELKLNISMGQVTTAAGDLIGIRSKGPGDSNAHARGGDASGWGLAGEEGPELIDFGNHSYVYTAAATRSMMASSSSSMTNATSTPSIVVNNNRRDIGVADLNHVLAMARLAS